MVQKDQTLETPQVDVEPSPSPVSGEPCVEAPGPVEDSGIGVEPSEHRKFISGVVEGNIAYLSMFEIGSICKLDGIISRMSKSAAMLLNRDVISFEI